MHAVPEKQIHPSSTMVTNPIYDGPVYETIHHKYNQLNSRSDSSSSPATSLSDSTCYSSDPTTHQFKQVCNTTPSEHPRRERNKLQLTLSFNEPLPSVLPDKGKNGTSAGEEGNTAIQISQRIDQLAPSPAEEEKYIVMNPAGNNCKFALNGELGGNNPKPTSKCQE